jgi:EAL domain-containing protein (putative c-di-GMP-specific phosphodiesterase class I)
MPSVSRASHSRAITAMELGRAIERHQLEVQYQPLVDLANGAVKAFEALLRWRHPEFGLIPPTQFIPVAEETGVIVPMGEWVLREACHQLKMWQARFPHRADLSMNVNLSVRQLTDPRLVLNVERILKETGVAPETVALELTEGSVASQMNSAREVLARLRDLRIRLKLDDFGTGYSSLSYLSTMRFDALKIDRSFVQSLCANPQSDAIIESVIDLARKLRMRVVAEGIETEAQRARLIALGCDTGQGFLFSAPVNADRAERLLETSPATPDLHALGGILKACSEPRPHPGPKLPRRLPRAVNTSLRLLGASSLIT